MSEENDDGSFDSNNELYDLVTSMDPLKLKCIGLEDKLSQHQKDGIAQMQLTVSRLLNVKKEYIDIVEKCFQKINCEVIGITSVMIAGIENRILKIKNCKSKLQSAFVSIEEKLEEMSEFDDIRSLVAPLAEKITDISKSVMEVDEGNDPVWPQLNWEDDAAKFYNSVHSLANVMASRQIFESLQQLQRIKKSPSSTEECHELQWISFRLPVSNNKSSLAAPFITSEVFLSGVSVQCEVHCQIKFDSLDFHIQAPPCRGINKLKISIQCFCEDVPNSPLSLTLQEGIVQSEPPAVIKDMECFVVPHAMLENSTKQWPHRSVLTGCICGKLATARRAATFSSKSFFPAAQSETCRGECMKDIFSKEKLASIEQACKTLSEKAPKNVLSHPQSIGSALYCKEKSPVKTEPQSPNDSGFVSAKKKKEESNVYRFDGSNRSTDDNNNCKFSNKESSKNEGLKKPPKHKPIVFDLTDDNPTGAKPKSNGKFNNNKTEFSSSGFTSTAPTPARYRKSDRGQSSTSKNSFRRVEVNSSTDNSSITTFGDKNSSTLRTNINSVKSDDHDDIMGDFVTADETGLREVVQDRLQGCCLQVYSSLCDGSQLKNATGVTQLPDESVVVCDTFNDRLIHFSKDAKTSTILESSPPLKHPSASTMLPFFENGDLKDQEISFAVKDQKAIYIFGLDGNQLRVLCSGKLRRPYGLSVDESGLLVTVETDVGATPTITKIDPITGNLRRVPFNLVNDSRTGKVSKPRFIACHRNNVLIIVDLGLDVIAMVSMDDGNIIRTFGGRGREPGLFNDPAGVVCDADGFIIIADSRNHRIQVFSPEGEFLSVLPIDRKVKRPSGLCLTPCGHLLVVNYWENSVVKYLLRV